MRRTASFGQSTTHTATAIAAGLALAAAAAAVAACGGGSGGSAGGTAGDGGSDAMSGADAPVADAPSGEGGMGDSGGLPPPAFGQTSKTQPNDFLATITDAPGATICYTEDGSAPTCSNGACTGTSSTYSSSARVSINGSVTDTSTGQVTVKAIACQAGLANSAASSETYTLQAAPPTFAGLMNGNQAYVPAAQFAPTVSSTTQASISQMNVPTIHFTTGSQAPTCSTGTTASNPTTFNAMGGPTLDELNGQIKALTCKAGYRPSAVVTWSYIFSLAAPTITGGTFHASVTVTQGTTPAPGNIVDSPNNTSDVLCATSDGMTPTCTPSGGCAATDATEVQVGVRPLRPGGASSPDTKIEVVACPSIAINPSAAASATFTLQLAQPFLSNDAPEEPGQPGWDTMTDGLPVTTFAIPASYNSATPFPYGDTCGGTAPCSLLVSQVQGPGTACTEGGAGCTPYTAADYFCWSVSGPASCGCSANNEVGTGGSLAGAPFALPSGAGVTAGQTLSLIACQNGGAAVVWAASTPTNVVISP